MALHNFLSRFRTTNSEGSEEAEDNPETASMLVNTSHEGEVDQRCADSEIPLQAQDKVSPSTSEEDASPDEDKDSPTTSESDEKGSESPPCVKSPPEEASVKLEPLSPPSKESPVEDEADSCTQDASLGCIDSSDAKASQNSSRKYISSPPSGCRSTSDSNNTNQSSPRKFTVSPQPSTSGRLKSTLLVHPAPQYNSHSSKAEAAHRTHSGTKYITHTSLSGSAVPTSVLVSTSRKDNYHSTNPEITSQTNSFSPIKVKTYTTNTVTNSTSSSPRNFEILRSAITGTHKMTEMRPPQKTGDTSLQSAQTACRSLVTSESQNFTRPMQNHSGPPQNYSANVQNHAGYVVGRSNPSHIPGASFQNSNTPSQHYQGTPQNRVGFPQTHGVNPQPGGTSAHPSGKPTSGSYGYSNHSPQNTAHQFQQQSPARSQVPLRRSSEGSQQHMVLIRAGKKFDSGKISLFLNGLIYFLHFFLHYCFCTKSFLCLHF